MHLYPKGKYSLRYDRYGVETETNRISPLLSAPAFTIDEVDEEQRPKFFVMREAIRISRQFKYDMDLFAKSGLQVVIYHDLRKYLGLTDVMRLFSHADLVGMKSIRFGRAVEIKAHYLL